MNATRLTAAVRDLIDARKCDVSALRSLFAGVKLTKAETHAMCEEFGYGSLTAKSGKAALTRLVSNLEGLMMSFYRAEVIAAM